MALGTLVSQCLYYTVKNVCGYTRVFGFLGVHGKSLPNNTEYSEFGDLVTKLTNCGTQNKRREQIALQNALGQSVYTQATFVAGGANTNQNTLYGPVGGMLHYKRSPQSVFYDAVAGTMSTTTVVGGALTLTTPCWATSNVY